MLTHELLDSCVLELDVMDLRFEGDTARFLAGKGSGDMIFCKRTSTPDILASFFRDLDDHVIDPYPIWGVELFPQDVAKRHTVLARILVSRIPDDPCSYHIDSWIMSGKKTIFQCHDLYGRHGIGIEIFSILLDTLASLQDSPVTP